MQNHEKEILRDERTENKVLPIERKYEILAKLMLDGKVIVTELAETYKVTEETIRRDLDKLEKEGLAKKTYGGAVKTDTLNVELPYMVRKQTNVEGKKYIAEIIANLISDGDYILLDSSTTALFTVKSMFSKQNITIITNSVEALMDTPSKNNWRVISTGGEFAQSSFAFFGPRVEEVVADYHVDVAVISGKGIDMNKGISDTSDVNARIKKAFIASAKKVILAMDSSKFDKISFVRFADIGDIHAVVTDAEPSKEWKDFFHSKNVEL